MGKAFLEVVSLVIALSSVAFGQQAFEPPQVSRAGDAYVQYYEPITDGLFVFDVAVNSNGGIERIDALRNPGAMIKAAENSVRSWQFQPAEKDNKPTASRLTVAIVYRPPDYGGAPAVPPANFLPVIPPSQGSGSGRGAYVPVGILSFDYPERPANSVAWGSAIVQITVSGSGAVTDVEFLRDMHGFDGTVRRALKKWRFRPARLSGTPISAEAVIAFVFETATPNVP
ncbi:MAG TPA: TonB family protein [Candidatus Acidoferrales bacterium]|nr:TonB family protein [Candidatus Acidoferrales bacterium]